jgi:peptidoglycan/xylan/chitin deacetylase (PgdA/CDA1 family)
MALVSLLTSIARAGSGPVVRRLTAGAPRVLMYHRFGPATSSRYLSREVFEQHLVYLKRHFRVRRLVDVVRALREGRALDPRTVVVTVDDGYRDFVDFAYPLLERYRVPATVFLATDFVDRRHWLWFDVVHYLLQKTSLSHMDVHVDGCRIERDLSTVAQRDRAWSAFGELCMHMDPDRRDAAIVDLQKTLRVLIPSAPTPEYEAMTWDAALQLDSTLVDFGSHTCGHPVLSRCTTAEVQRELCESKRLIEARLNRPVETFAYPHGEAADYDQRAVDAAEAAGYLCATVAHGGPLVGDVNLFQLKRMSAATDIGQFRSTVNGVEFLANQVRAWRHAATF